VRRSRTPPARLPEPAPTDGAGGLRVTAMIQTSAALPAVRAMLVLRAVRDLGEVADVQPGEADLAAGNFSGTLRFTLHTDRDPDEVRAAVLRAGEVSHAEVESPSAAVRSDAEESAADAEPVRGVDSFVRVSQRVLDTMVDRIGELVIARDRITARIAGGSDPDLKDAAGHLSRLVGELRDEVMRMRMVPIGDAFDRFPRFVRDAARSLGKQVRFEVAGRDTPLDRSLHHELADVLIHLLRNALDHGIEPADERGGTGKPAAGVVRLSAEAERSHVVVRVEDDGRGIDLGAVARAAVESGHLTERAAADATRDELLGLLTRAGFSTRREVTDVSGRGVGLDVVASRIRVDRRRAGDRDARGRGHAVHAAAPAVARDPAHAAGHGRRVDLRRSDQRDRGGRGAGRGRGARLGRGRSPGGVPGGAGSHALSQRVCSTRARSRGTRPRHRS
jgi:two-component system, chemotaxis family, sensor kinase CheA